MPNETLDDLPFLSDELENAKEGADDLQNITPALLTQAVLSTNDWTAQTIISQIDKGNIGLDPKFQRRDAWQDTRKSRFIESLLLGLPVPQLVLAEKPGSKGSYIIIDGKQRLLTIRQFASERDDSKFSQLKLRGLDVRKDLNGQTLQSMMANPEYAGDITAFENQPIRTVVIRNWSDERFLYLVFLRLNTGSVPLAPQELRQALHPGPFLEYADEMSGKSRSLKDLLDLDKPDFRMRDVELLIRFFGFRNFLSDYAGNLKDFLDHVCEQLNDSFSNRKPELDHQFSDFEQAHESIFQIFGKNSCRKWTGKSYEKRFNRAIYDVMFYYFSSQKVRRLLSGKERAIEEAFQSLCTSNREFLASIESTTKSLSSTSTRLQLWGAELQRLLETHIDVPSLVDGRIV